MDGHLPVLCPTTPITMDDNVSINSSDSVTTSGEYEIVPELIDCGADPSGMLETGSKPPTQSPKLAIFNNGDMAELAKNMHEVIHDMDDTFVGRQQTTSVVGAVADSSTVSGLASDNTVAMGTTSPTCIAGQDGATTSATMLEQPSETFTANKVGLSVFYDCIDLSPTDEKQDKMKHDRSDTEEEMSEIDQDCTIFAGVTYLGAATINAPKSMIEVQRNMAELNGISEANSVGIKVSVSIPSKREGLVVLSDATSNAVIAHYEVKRILFYARGPVGSADQACFAFTWSHGDSQDSVVFQCHIFKCLIPEAVAQVSACFSKAFELIPAPMTSSVISPPDTTPMMSSITSDITGNPISSAQYEFIVALEIREKMSKNTYTSVPRDRNSFRLRCNTDKEIAITVKQSPSSKLAPLFIERCFGVLLSPGKLVRQADMQLLDMVTMGYQKAEPSQSGSGTVGPTSSTIPSSSPASVNWLNPYIIRAEWKSSDKNFERLNTETNKMFITVAIDLVIKGIQEPVRFVIETPVTIQANNDFMFMKYLSSGGKKTMMQRFYLQLKDSGDGGWEVNSIDPSDEIVQQAGQNSIMKNLGNFSKMVRSPSIVSTPYEDELPSDESSGDEPLLSGTGEVSKDCSQDTLNEWEPVLQEWDGDRRPKNLVHLVRLGVPEALRGNVWQRLANVENKTAIRDLYRVLLTKDTKCEDVIQRDINRTFPAHKVFRETGGTGQDSLFKVSKAYAVYDQEVGYCQGLSFVAATLLLHMPEEDAFCVLISLMYDYGLRKFYQDGFENLYLRLYQLNRLMKDQLPKLFEHFERIGIETHMFASQWFLTLFTARFPLYFVFHILDVFLLDGMPILFQVALTLLAVCEAELRQLDFEGVLKFVRVSLPKKCRSPAQARKLMKLACDRKVKKMRQYEEEFVANKETTEKQEALDKQFDLKFNEERLQLRTEISLLKSKYDQFVEKQNVAGQTMATILQDYKQIIQRQEQQLSKSNQSIEELKKTTESCAMCSQNITGRSGLDQTDAMLRTASHDNEHAPLGPLDPLNVALQRIRELELELAQTKLAHVEAECKNQDLNHQLNSTLSEIQSSRNSSWQPWLSKTINTIQEKVATRRDAPSFQTYVGSSGSSTIPDGNVINSTPHAAPLQEFNRDRDSPKTGKPRLQSTSSLSKVDYTKHDVSLTQPYSRNSVN